MGYILALLIIIGGIIAVTLGSNPLAGVIDQTKATIVDYISPKTQTEVIIDNLRPSHEALERFFSVTAPTILKSQTIPAQELKELETAIEAFTETQEAITQIQQAERDENGITETIIKKVLQAEATPQTSPQSTSTPLPPQCRIECN